MAFKPDATAPNGRRRLVTGRTSACTEDGLQAFIERHEGAGDVVDVLEVRPFDLIADMERDHNGNARY